MYFAVDICHGCIYNCRQTARIKRIFGKERKWRHDDVQGYQKRWRSRRFDIAKISSAISKAFDALNKETHPTVIDLLALKVTSDFEGKIKDGLIAVEDIQDSVESVLSQAGYADVAKAYILYRKQREKSET